MSHAASSESTTPRFSDTLLEHAQVLSIAAFFVVCCLGFALGTDVFLSRAIC